MVVVKECRFCLEEELTAGDAWLSPCACAGTIKWVHQRCLNEWVTHGATNDEQRTRCPVCRHEYVRRPRFYPVTWWSRLLAVLGIEIKITYDDSVYVYGYVYDE